MTAKHVLPLLLAVPMMLTVPQTARAQSGARDGTSNTIVFYETPPPAGLKYKVEVRLVKADAPKVVDTDNTEDIFGFIKVNEVRVDGRRKGGEHDLYNIPGSSTLSYPDAGNACISNSARVTPLRRGMFTNFASSCQKVLVRDLTLDEVLKTQFRISGSIKDKEIPFDFSYVCKECNGGLSIDLSRNGTSIRALTKGGGKTYGTTLNWYENGDLNASHVRFFVETIVSAY